MHAIVLPSKVDIYSIVNNVYSTLYAIVNIIRLRVCTRIETGGSAKHYSYYGHDVAVSIRIGSHLALLEGG